MKPEKKNRFFKMLAAALIFHAVLALVFYYLPLPYKKWVDDTIAAFNLESLLQNEPEGPGLGDGTGLPDAVPGEMKVAPAASSPSEELGDVPLAALLTENASNEDSQAPSLSRQSQIRALAKSAEDRQSELFEIQNRESADDLGTTAAKSTEDLKVFELNTAEKAQIGESAAGVDALNQASIGALEAMRAGTIDPEEGMPGFTPGASVGRVGPYSGSDSLDQGVGSSPGGVSRFESIDDFLDIQVYTYEQPGEAKKYFMVKIFAKPGKAFKVQPKEMLFTVDASLSISPERLDQFKRGIVYALKNLNPDDTFNVIAFKDKAAFLSPVSVKADDDAIRRAEKFVGELTASERTDVYAAFDRIIKLPLSRKPSNVILISDGRPTYGVVDSRELISSVTRANAGVRPVFAFSGGSKVNRYLLDFLAYQNRAWSQYVKKTPDIGKGLADLYAKIKDPLFLNLRYRLSGIEGGEIYPKALPDFYKGAEFTLFGTYGDETEFSMQLLGDVDGKTKELVFTRSLEQAPKGGADIRQGWAFNKIYDLISRMTKEGQTQAGLEEVRRLSQAYDVTTPYSPEQEIRD